ncbi:Transforming growth factor beta-1-induced transcript 1 protein [Rhizopus stolonifer]|uniref:Transforming growth factor beta-1-induced transcript 1 protein n=1 Tax=Rhizopus stolonifer TaxID=4846 RepID=A0A367KVP0_RHIST|nr:Transforming growth factor beta-1-induced transcript 1 protein [Rhizopus stolonifer]
MTKDQLETYLNGLPKNTSKKDQLKNQLVYPPTIEDQDLGSIRDRMSRLRTATGTVLTTTQAMTPAFPETPKPAIPSKPVFSGDAFEASLTPKSRRSVIQPPRVALKPSTIHTSSPTPVTKPSPPATPPMPVATPPPAVPNSPRPPRPSSDKVSILNPIYAGLDCPGCQQPIKGSVVSAMDRIWHAHCFVCTQCNKTLENEQYFVHDDQPFCAQDYRVLFSLRCDLCHKPIEHSAISALGKHYHEGHFCCTVCDMPFGDYSAFLVHEGRPYCQQDYMKVCGKKCSGCGEYISGEYINALEQPWHKSCFVCTECRQPFTGGSFLVRDNKPYCEKHPNRPSVSSERKPSIPTEKRPSMSTERKPSIPTERKPSISTEREPLADKRPPVLKPKPSIKSDTKSNKTCHHCGDMIDGPCASALGHDYHVHHFQCSQCQRTLSSRVPGKKLDM